MDAIVSRSVQSAKALMLKVSPTLLVAFARSGQICGVPLPYVDPASKGVVFWLILHGEFVFLSNAGSSLYYVVK